MRTILVLLFLVCIGVIYFEAADRPLRQSQLQTVDGQRVLHLVGSYYEMGRAQGALLHDQVGETVKRLTPSSPHGFDNSPDGKGEGYDLRRTPERYREEMRGLSHGCDEPFDRIECMHGEDVGPALAISCGLFGTKTVGGKLIMLQSIHDDRFTEALAVVYHPPDGQDYVTVTCPGFLGGLSGMNAHGVAITGIPVYHGGLVDLGRVPRTPAGFLVREALRTATCQAEAVRYLEQAQPADFAIFMVGDAKAPDCRVVERTPDKVASFGPGDALENKLLTDPLLASAPIPDCMRRSMFFIDPTLQDSLPIGPIPCSLAYARTFGWARQEYGEITKTLKGFRQPVSVQDVIAWLRTFGQREYYNGCHVVFCPADRDFWLARASGKGGNQDEAPPFQRFNLKRLHCRQAGK